MTFIIAACFTTCCLIFSFMCLRILKKTGPVIANTNFKLIAQLIPKKLNQPINSCMDITIEQKIPIRQAPKHRKVFTKRKTQTRQKALGPIAPTNSLVRIVAMHYTYKPSKLSKSRCIRAPCICLQPIAPILSPYQLLVPQVEPSTARPSLFGHFKASQRFFQISRDFSYEPQHQASIKIT